MISFPCGPSVDITTLLFSSISRLLSDLHLTYTCILESEVAAPLLQVGGVRVCIPFERLGDGACAMVLLLFASNWAVRRLGKEERAMIV